MSLLLTAPWVSTYPLYRAYYNLYLHPLSKFPGPRFAGASKIPMSYYTWTGELPHYLLRLHEQYQSEVVRFSRTNSTSSLHKHGKTFTRPRKATALSTRTCSSTLMSKILLPPQTRLTAACDACSAMRSPTKPYASRNR